MNRGTGYLTALAVISAMTFAACSEGSMPTAPTTAAQFTAAGEMGVLSALQNPVVAATRVGRDIDLVFSAGASGTQDAPSIVAARSIESVDFEVYDPFGHMLGSRTTNEVPTSGVLNGENGIASLTVFAKATVLPSTSLAAGSYAIARVHGIGGDVLVVRTDLPASPQ